MPNTHKMENKKRCYCVISRKAKKILAMRKTKKQAERICQVAVERYADASLLDNSTNILAGKRYMVYEDELITI